jgi:hypothetical protein
MFEQQMQMYFVDIQMDHKNSNSNSNSNNTNTNTDMLCVSQLICDIRSYSQQMHGLTNVLILGLGWDAFLMYSHILRLLIRGFDLLEQCEIKRQLTNNMNSNVNMNMNMNLDTKCIDSYLYVFEDLIMRRLKRAVTVRRPSTHSARRLFNNRNRHRQTSNSNSNNSNSMNMQQQANHETLYLQN